MNTFALEWLSLLGRWVHLITGIAWIGASFYFVWLDNHLLAPTEESLRDKGVGGELWAVHGGGFYNAQKYRIAPRILPDTLHWFYWEAYSTFLSGLFLLIVVYYAQAEVYLIDPRVAALSKPVAIAASLASLVIGWVAYDLLCRSPLARHGARLGFVIGTGLCGAAYALCHLFSGRGAYITFGAMLGAIMVANVFFVIIPGQRAMVEAKRQGREPDAAAGVRGKQRSVHNTYFTLPVLFTMLSNHYAMTFAADYNWLVLIVLCAAGACIRWYFVARHKRHERGGRTAPWPALLGLGLIAATVIALAHATRPADGAAPSSATAVGRPTFAAVQRIVAARCAPCHAETPRQPGFSVAPKGVLLDTAEDLLARVDLIGPQVESRAMPIANLTGMTEAERGLLLTWIHDGSPH